MKSFGHAALAAALLGGLTLAACTRKPRPPVNPAATPPWAGCSTASLEDLVGREASEQTVAEARKRAKAALVRLKPPGAMVTMDYRPDRLNLTLDAQNRITALNCG